MQGKGQLKEFRRHTLVNLTEYLCLNIHTFSKTIIMNMFIKFTYYGEKNSLKSLFIEKRKIQNSLYISIKTYIELKGVTLLVTDPP